MKTYKIKIDGKEYEVLGCPWCGETPKITSFPGVTIECRNVGACDLTPVLIVNYLEDAIKRWNKRA